MIPRPVEDPIFWTQGPGGKRQHAFFRELTKRVTRCRVCGGPIKKGEYRIKEQIRLNEPIETRKGGTIFKQVRYFHPRCLASIFNADEQIGPGQFCFMCGESFGRNHPYAGLAKAAGTWGGICTHCAQKGWHTCETCTTWFPKHLLSPRVLSNGNLSQDKMYCKRCVDDYHIECALRWQKREAAEDRKVRAAFDKIKSELKSKGI